MLDEVDYSNYRNNPDTLGYNVMQSTVGEHLLWCSLVHLTKDGDIILYASKIKQHSDQPSI